MPRDEQVEYEQDRLGNERRKLDSIRAREGAADGFDNGGGLAEVGSGETGADQLVYSAPTHADRTHLIQVRAHNSGPSGGNTFHILEGQEDGSGGISNTTRRSVDLEVASGNTRTFDYEGEDFPNDIGVNSEFAGQISVGVIADHDEASEPDTENTNTP